MPDPSEPAPLDLPELPGRPATSERDNRSLSLVILALVCCVSAAVVVGLVFAVMSGRGSEQSTANVPASLQPAETTTTTVPTTEAPTTEPPITEETTPPPTESVPVSRDAELYSTIARIRGVPNLTGAELGTLEGLDGLPIRVIGTNQNGWYQIEANGLRGWIFGAFVIPPDPGFSVGVTRDGAGARLLNSSGAALRRTNSSGSKVLITDVVGDLYRILLPEGDEAYVTQSSILVVSSS